MAKQTVSIADVARIAGVSISTVSHLINGTHYVSPETAARIQQAIEATGYRQNLLARALRARRTGNVGIILTSVNPGNFYGRTLTGIESVLDAAGFRMIVSASGDDPERENDAINSMLAWHVDGLILVPSSLDRPYSRIPCPTVLIEREVADREVSDFYSDNAPVAAQAVLRMADAGRKNIALICPIPRFRPTMDRLAGYKAGLVQAGLPIREELMLFGQPVAETGAALMTRLLNETDADAAIITSSPMTVGAVRTLNDRNIPIPGRMSLFTFANYEWTPMCNPPLDGAMQYNREIGIAAARRLLKQMDGDSTVEIRGFPATYLRGKSIIA